MVGNNTVFLFLKGRLFMKSITHKIAAFIITVLLLLPLLTACKQDNSSKLLDFIYTPQLNDEYIVLEKSPEDDFIILNLTDTQLFSSEWEEGNINREILEYTVNELVNKTQPDLITISGDLAWAGETQAYKMLADLIDSFGVPWAPVWGNHDNEDGLAYVDVIEELYMTYENCIYLEGPEEFGSGNYIISIEENGTPITGIFMMDTHDHDYQIDEVGNKVWGYSRLYNEQLLWYQGHAVKMKKLGYKDSAIIMHIPIYAYKDAFNEAFNINEYSPVITWEESYNDKYWNEGYKGSFGVRYELGGFPPVEDGVIDIIEDIGHTKYMITGHDHVNNFVINYRGINLVYALKTGMGCYWHQSLNGGTVIKVSSEGISELYHEYINVDHIVEAHNN